MLLQKYKDVFERCEQFWERTNKGRPILHISYEKDGFVPYRKHNSPEEKYLDVNYRYNAYKHNLANVGYLAEGLPMCFADFGPGNLAEALGGGFQLADTTVWFDKVLPVKDMENLPDLTFDPNSTLWKKLEESQTLYAADPDVHFSVADLGGIMDVAASLQGTENLLFDLYDYPEEVKMLSAMVKREWFKAYDRQLRTVEDAGQPYNTWMNIPSKKPWYPIQCDFCYMISPAQFEEFVLEDLWDQTQYIDRTIYHLDGPGELPHLDMLLDMEDLNGIQWTAGDGNEPLWDEKWFSLYRRIQDKKKNLVLLGGIQQDRLDEAERMIKSLDPTGLYISISCSSKDRAEEALEKITRWSE